MVDKSIKATRRTRLADLLKNCLERTPTYTGAVVREAPNNALHIKITKDVTDLGRFKSLPFSTSFLYAKDQNAVFPLNSIADDGAGAGVVAQSVSKSGRRKVIVRAADGDSKDIFIEVWNDASSGAFQSSLKLSKDVSKVFHDTVFGTIAWSKDESKVCFVGEVPAPAAFKSPWENKAPKEEAKKAEAKKDEDKKEEEKEEHWQEEKFLYRRDFGEALIGKEQAGLFVFDLKENKVNQVLGIPDDLHPQFPIFDENSTGLVFSAVRMPVMKLGLVFCLNRPTQLYHIADPVFDKKKLKGLAEERYLRQINPKTEYLAMHPRFSADFSRLAYIGRDEQFLSHSANYQLKMMNWP